MTLYLADYAQFKSKADMEEAIQLHISMHWKHMNNTDRAVLDIISLYSVDLGAAHLKHKIIEMGVNKSNATVRRTIRKLEKLEIIERIHYIRPIMSGLGANIYVIKPFN